MLSQGAFSIWMVVPFIWGGVGVAIILGACVRDIIATLRSNGRRQT